MTKECSKCKVEKEVSCFDKCKNVKSGLYPSCKDCRKEYRLQNLLLIKDKNKVYYESVKSTDEFKSKSRNYYLKNRIKKINYSKEYFKSNKEHVIKRQNTWVKNKMERDPTFKLTQRIRRIIRRTLERKNSRSIDYIGVSNYEEFFKLLTDKCDNKNWSDEKYHLDHIWQVHWFEDALHKNPEHVSRIIHNHKNLRPISPSENFNRSKSDFTALNKEDFYIYEQYLNSDICKEIKQYFIKENN
jgi:hypothetical protein